MSTTAQSLTLAALEVAHEITLATFNRACRGSTEDDYFADKALELHDEYCFELAAREAVINSVVVG